MTYHLCVAKKRIKKVTLSLWMLLWIGLFSFTPRISFASTFVIPQNGNIIGEVQRTTVEPGDSIATISLRYDMGGYEMLEANPGIDYDRPKPGTVITIPSRYILPEAPHKGIVINLAEMRLYHYHDDGVHVSTYPVGVGQEGWNTPLGKSHITRKRLHPTWVVPDSIMENHRKHGKIIPKVKPPGPTNPLGDYAMNISFKGIVIHGTPQPKAVGVRSSHGCIRMRNEDVGALFHGVKVGTPVYIIHQPTKIGQLNGRIYLESHVPISQELTQADQYDLKGLIKKVVPKGKDYQVEWAMIERLQNRPNGIPLPIGSIMH